MLLFYCTVLCYCFMLSDYRVVLCTYASTLKMLIPQGIWYINIGISSGSEVIIVGQRLANLLEESQQVKSSRITKGGYILS